MYGWLLNSIDQEYAVIRVLKESPRGSVRLIRHKALGTRLILRRFQGSGGGLPSTDGLCLRQPAPDL